MGKNVPSGHHAENLVVLTSDPCLLTDTFHLSHPRKVMTRNLLETSPSLLTDARCFISYQLVTATTRYYYYYYSGKSACAGREGQTGPGTGIKVGNVGPYVSLTPLLCSMPPHQYQGVCFNASTYISTQLLGPFTSGVRLYPAFWHFR